MNWRNALWTALLASAALKAHAADSPRAIPADFPASRYDTMSQQVPFAVATAVAPVVEAPSFAADLYVTGVARIGDTNLVTISSRDKTRRFSVFSGETNPREGIEIISVDWSDTVGGSKVSVKKGSEYATLVFDQAELAKPLAPEAQAPPLPGVAGSPVLAPSTGGETGSRPSIRVRRRTIGPIPGPR